MVKNSENSFFSKKLLHQYFSVLAASFLFFINGLQLGFVSPALVILEEQGYYKIPPISSGVKTWIITCSTLGIVPGAIWVSYINDLLGRKYSMMLIIVPQLSTQLLVYFATTVYMFFISEFIRGISNACVFSVIPIYISEIAPPKLRGSFTVVCILCLQIGSLTGSLIQSLLSIDLRAMTCILIVLMIIPILCLITESPYFYVTKHRDAESKNALRKFLRVQNVEKEFEEINSAWIENTKIKQSSWAKIFVISSNRKIFLTCVGVQSIQQLSGYLPMISNVHSIVHNSGLQLSLAIISLVINTVGIVAAILSIFIVDSWGRKPLFVTICSGILIGHSLTGFGFYMEANKSEKSVLFASIEFTGIIIYKAMFGLGLQQLPNILSSELLPTDIKSKGCSLLMLLSSVDGIISVHIFDFLYNISGYVAFVFMASVPLVGLIFGIYFVPETKSKSLVEIQKELK